MMLISIVAFCLFVVGFIFKTTRKEYVKRNEIRSLKEAKDKCAGNANSCEGEILSCKEDMGAHREENFT